MENSPEQLAGSFMGQDGALLIDSELNAFNRFGKLKPMDIGVSGEMIPLPRALVQLAPQVAAKISSGVGPVTADLEVISLNQHARLMKAKELCEALCSRDNVNSYFDKKMRRNTENLRGSFNLRISQAYRGVYKTIFDMPLRQKMIGLWPLVFVDAASEVDNNLSVSQFGIESLVRHPNLIYAQVLDADRLAKSGQLFFDVIASLNAKAKHIETRSGQFVNPRMLANARDILKIITEIVVILNTVADTVKTLQELWKEHERQRAEAEAQAKAEEEKRRIEEEKRKEEERLAAQFAHDMREAHAIEHSSDFIDHFEHNADMIGRTA